ncbi:hypothetical protein M0R04_10370 [Candidatus Dojkabacteria bacterium]|jgi:hypothetical protein|nr:hypothetical protein [Candidatus Dojkabacteria bacterium]
MKIKNLFTSIEFTPKELEDLMYTTPMPFKMGLIWWIKDKFGLDLLPKLNNTQKSKNTKPII